MSPHTTCHRRPYGSQSPAPHLTENCPTNAVHYGDFLIGLFQIKCNFCEWICIFWCYLIESDLECVCVFAERCTKGCHCISLSLIFHSNIFTFRMLTCWSTFESRAPFADQCWPYRKYYITFRLENTEFDWLCGWKQDITHLLNVIEIFDPIENFNWMRLGPLSVPCRAYPDHFEILC